MKAVFATAPDPDDPLSAVVVGHRPDPEVPLGWVRVEVGAASLNHKDLWTLRGVGINRDQYPRILGCEAAGERPDGTGVVPYPLLGSSPGMSDETLAMPAAQLVDARPGTLAEYVAAPPESLLPVPDHLSWEEAACLVCTWLPAYQMLFTKAALRPGVTVLVQRRGRALHRADQPGPGERRAHLGHRPLLRQAGPGPLTGGGHRRPADGRCESPATGRTDSHRSERMRHTTGAHDPYHPG
ncbi:medium chain dehydrogenase/reductase family protein [Streptomyces sp. NPDC006510]|uniref:medium chain dehydrogenase/reductase family protein n=1 Tax=Streptomyces sp. NPDC006510 TaxID=3155600 RepID=UPI0033A234BB